MVLFKIAFHRIFFAYRNLEFSREIVYMTSSKCFENSWQVLGSFRWNLRSYYCHKCAQWREIANKEPWLTPLGSTLHRPRVSESTWEVINNALVLVVELRPRDRLGYELKLLDDVAPAHLQLQGAIKQFPVLQLAQYDAELNGHLSKTYFDS